MPGKVLRRCAICKKFHASYLVNSPELGSKAYLCYSCWKARNAPQPSSASGGSFGLLGDQADEINTPPPAIKR